MKQVAFFAGGFIAGMAFTGGLFMYWAVFVY